MWKPLQHEVATISEDTGSVTVPTNLVQMAAMNPGRYAGEPIGCSSER